MNRVRIHSLHLGNTSWDFPLTTTTRKMNRKCWMALFVVLWTICVSFLVHRWITLSGSMYSCASSVDSTGNSVDTKQIAITNQRTALQGNSKSMLVTINATSSNGNLRNFIYTIQTESCISPYLLRPEVFGDGRKNDVLILSWKQPCAQENSRHLKHIKYIYKANSSWSEGRNILYHFVKEMPKNYLYYIFMDDDMTFDFNSDFSKRYRDLGINSPLQAFENFLLKHEPAIGLPLYCGERNSPNCDKMKRLKPIPEYLPVTIWFDAAFNAFHRNAVDLMLPYRLDYEQKSWWQSQKFVILAADLIFRGQILRFAPVIASNNVHREYPRWDADNWAHIYNILKDEMPNEFKDKVIDWKPNDRNINAVPVVQGDIVITPMGRMKIPVGKITVEPYKHLKTS